MRFAKHALLFLLVNSYLAENLHAQDLSKCRKQSYYTYIFKIDAEKVRKVYEIEDFIEADLLTTALDSFLTDSGYKKQLPEGHYVFIKAEGDDLKTEIKSVSSFGVFLYSSKKKLLIQLYNKKDFSPIEGGTVTIKGRKVHYNNKTRTHSFRKIKEGFVSVSLNSEKAFFTIENEEYEYNPKFNLGFFLRRLFSKRRNYYREDQNPGYIVFNKPIYQPQDTVKFKALILTKNGKYFNKPVKILFGKRYNEAKTELVRLNPNSPGAYVYQFVLGDSLQIDSKYEIEIVDAKTNKSLQSSYFDLEDYQLDETSYGIKAEKENYNKGEPIVLKAWGKDANGFYLQDARLDVTVRTSSIDKFHSDSIFIPRTLWKGGWPLESGGETKIILPDSIIPLADFTLLIDATFNNSSHETHDTTLEVEYNYSSRNIEVKIEKENIVATYYVNGKSTPTEGYLTKKIDDEQVREAISFPYKGRLDITCSEYEFNTNGVYGTLDEDLSDYLTRIVGYQNKDSVFIVMINPYELDLTYSIRKGNKVIQKGVTKQLNFKIRDVNKEPYFIDYHFTWNGEPFDRTSAVQFFNKSLHIDINQPTTIFPGQKTNIKIKVTDANKNPVKDVNITALGVNAQFKQNNVPYLFYLGQTLDRDYNNSSSRIRLFSDEENIDLLSPYWRNRMHLDTMPYYKMLFPKNGLCYNYDSISSINAQIAPFLFKNGRQEYIYIIYIDDMPVYYYDTDNMHEYSFIASPGYHSFRLRTFDKEYSLDSILLKKGKKLDLGIDMEHLPKYSYIVKKDNELSEQEKYNLKNYVIFIHHTSSKKGYLWQENKVFTFPEERYSYNRLYKLGGFFPDKMHYAIQDQFHKKFTFEPGYEYIINEENIKLISSNPFDKTVLFSHQYSFPNMGMKATLVNSVRLQTPDLWCQNYVTYNSSYSEWGNSEFVFDYKGDSAICLIRVERVGKDSLPQFYKNPERNAIKNLKPGFYNITFITPYKYFVEKDSVKIDRAGTFFLRFGDKQFQKFESGSAEKQNSKEPINKTAWQNPIEKDLFNAYSYGGGLITNGKGAIKVNAIDKKTKEGIPFANVIVYGRGKQIASGTTDLDGYAFIKPLPAGKFDIRVVYIGYKSFQLNEVIVTNDKVTYVTIPMSNDANIELQEVACYYMAPLIDPNTVSGCTVTRESFMAMADKSIEGVLSTAAGVYSSSPNIYIDGERLIGTANVSRSAVEQRSILDKDGESGIDSSKKENYSIRKNFSDYAYWQPNLITDKNGEASFDVTFPDNNTSWRTYALAMDDKKHSGRADRKIRSFKKITASLSLPRFLVEGDDAIIIGKSLNYTTKPSKINSGFAVNGVSVFAHDTLLTNIVIEKQNIKAENTDSLSVRYSMEQLNGLKDGEERKIPVFEKGSLETEGTFKVLNSDTSFSIEVKNNSLTEIYVQNNPIDFMLDELKQLENYPYWCMEQTASKLNGLLMQEKIFSSLNKNISKGREINKLLRKLGKAQKQNGSWGWWADSPDNIWMTCYISRIINKAIAQGYNFDNKEKAVNAIIRDLGSLKGNDFLYALSTLSEFKTQIPYSEYLKKIERDSLSFYQKLLVTKIRQENGIPYEIQYILKVKKETMMQSCYWGEENTNWYDNNMKTTILAYKVIEKADSNNMSLQKIRNYFLEMKGQNKWNNTIETASILETMLPRFLKNSGNSLIPTQVNLSGLIDKNISSFPYKAQVKNSSVALNVQKKGTSPVFFTIYQKQWNKNPIEKKDLFSINTHFEAEGKNTDTLRSGVLTEMVIEIEVKKKAEYVMLEIPIPAGCSYDSESKSQAYYETHREYYKNKTNVFFQELPAGKHICRIILQPRFNGKYTVNPVKAELMYFPTLFGRNSMKKTVIK
jgi:alpha-2-macroglobulin